MANIVVHESDIAPAFMRFTAVDNDRESELSNLIGFGPTAEAALAHLFGKLDNHELAGLYVQATMADEYPAWLAALRTEMLTRCS